MIRNMLAASMLAMLAASCLTPKTIKPTQYYTVTPDTVESGDVKSPLTLGIRPLIAARPYKLEVAYRADPNRLAYLRNAEWAELPGTVVSRALADAITRSNFFQDAGDANDMTRPDAYFTGELRRFEADFARDDPQFVITIVASIRMAGEGNAIWHEHIDVEIPLDVGSDSISNDEAATGIARAASDAISQLSIRLCASIESALEQPQTP